MRQEPRSLVTAPRASLSRQISLILAVTVSLILILFAVLAIPYSQNQKRTQLQQEFSHAMRLAETSLSEAVWQLDLGSINDILRAILIDKAVVMAGVQVDGVMVASQSQPGYQGREFTSISTSADYLVDQTVIHRQGRQVGTLLVAMSAEEINREARTTAFVAVGLLLLLVVTVLLTSLLVLRKYIFVPLARLERSAREVVKGNWDTPILVQRDDEIGSLASALTTMTGHLKESVQTLEDTVLRRTWELSDAKAAAERNSQHLASIGAELHALLDNSPVGIVLADRKGLIRRANPEMGKITGYDNGGLAGENLELLIALPDQLKEIEGAVESLVAGQSVAEHQVVVVRRDGQTITCQLRGKAIQGEQKIEGIIWIFSDITERLHMEQELLRAKKQESVGVLAGGIAHDFNNILFAVIGNLSLAERLSEPETTLKGYIHSARQAAVRAKELTSRLLAFAEGGDPVRSSTDLSVLVKERLLATGVESHGRILVDSGLWPVHIDRQLISQVLDQLLTNAQESLSPGGQVKVTLQNCQVAAKEVVGLMAGRYVRVVIEDSGRGIDGDLLEKVFDPYFSTRERDSRQGSGLGLAIVQSLVRKHEGSITVSSKAGKGTSFVLHLPALRADSPEEQRRAGITPTGKGRILLFGQETQGTHELGEMLEHMGYNSTPISRLSQLQHELTAGREEREKPVAVVAVECAPEISTDVLIGLLRQFDSQLGIVVVEQGDAGLGEDTSPVGVERLASPVKLLELDRAMKNLARRDKAYNAA